MIAETPVRLDSETVGMLEHNRRYSLTIGKPGDPSALTIQGLRAREIRKGFSRDKSNYPVYVAVYSGLEGRM